MRESDRVLHDALRAAGLDDLAERAGRGEWNDYFGLHAMPQHHLLATLQDRRRRAGITAAQAIEVLCRRVVDGEFDGTRAESDEWAASAEGREISAEIFGSIERRRRDGR